MEELDIGDNWILVQGDVDKILEHAIKTVPVRTVRLNLEVARKYFSLMTKLMTKRNETIRQVKFGILIYVLLLGYLRRTLLQFHFFLQMISCIRSNLLVVTVFCEDFIAWAKCVTSRLFTKDPVTLAIFLANDIQE